MGFFSNLKIMADIEKARRSLPECIRKVNEAKSGIVRMQSLYDDTPSLAQPLRNAMLLVIASDELVEQRHMAAGACCIALATALRENENKSVIGALVDATNFALDEAKAARDCSDKNLAVFKHEFTHAK